MIKLLESKQGYLYLFLSLGIAQAALQHKQSLALDLELSRREMLTQYRDQRGFVTYFVHDFSLDFVNFPADFLSFISPILQESSGECHAHGYPYARHLFFSYGHASSLCSRGTL
jgi:hypothetical protein